ncbi:thermonuclease family protein [Mesorhizobium sp. CAU 1732]|uniref:thermonuclease family protein n=1 Tax=Mesorhizobium sp. CAU 1732 TaxID=3140358 RepID=UPI003260B4C4
MYFVLIAATIIGSAGPAIQTIDGDTIEIDSERIRIANIDAPEIRHAKCDAERRLGLVAKRRVIGLMDSGEVVVLRGDPDTGRIKDRYGRTLATISVGGRDVGAVLVEEGLARPWGGRREPWCDSLTNRKN